MQPRDHPLFQQWLAALDRLEALRADLDSLRAELRSGSIVDMSSFRERWHPLEQATRQAGIAEEKAMNQLLEAWQREHSP